MATKSSVHPVPEGFHTVTPYLVARGAAKLIEFMKQAFDAHLLGSHARPDGTIQHSALRIGDSMIELGDYNEQYPPMPCSLHLYVPDADAVYRGAIAAGGKSLEEPVDQPYGDRESGVEDPSGNYWWISTYIGAGRGPGKHLRQGFRTVTPGFFARGAAELLEFMKRGLGGEEVAAQRSADGKVAHAEVCIGDSMVVVSEAHGQWGPRAQNLHLYVPDTDAAYHRAVAAGARSEREPALQFYGDRAAGVQDAWGNYWWFATRVEEVSEEELARRIQAMRQKS